MESQTIHPQNIRRAIYLETFTVAYMIFEAGAALYIGISTASASLETFGLDSIIELVSAFVLLWRLTADQRGADAEHIEHIETRAAKFVGATLFLLAVYVAVQSVYTLITQSRPEASIWGVGLALLSLIIMPVLGKLKLRVADQIHSRALHADAFESIACAYLSFTLLLGLAANYFFGWWWADPVAALVMLYFIVREAREAWAGEHEDDDETPI